MVIIYYDQTKTEMVVGLLATSKVILLIINNQVFLKTLKLLFQIYYFLIKSHHWALSSALGKLPFQSNEIYLHIDFNVNLFFEGHYVLKKHFKRLKDAQLKHRLLKPYVETFLAFELNQLKEKQQGRLCALCLSLIIF